MSYESSKYIAIHELILHGADYRTIAQLLNVNKNTVTATRKRFQETGLVTPPRTRRSKYDPYLQECTAKIAHYLSLKRKTCQLYKTAPLTREEIYTLMLTDGFTLSYTKFQELYRLENNKRKESFYHIHYLPGEIVQFDWGWRLLNIDGTNRRVYFAVFVFPYSNYHLAYVTHRENGKSFAWAFNQFIKDTGIVPKTLLVDNMSIARKIKKDTPKGKQLTLLFQELSHHYGFKVQFCAEAHPQSKGHVENTVKVIKKALKDSYISHFDSFNDVQHFVTRLMQEKNQQIHPTKHDTCSRLYHHEKALMEKPPRKPFSYFAHTQRKVNRDSLVLFKNARYTVPEGHQGQRLDIRYNDHTLYVLDAEGQVIAKHRISRKKKTRRFRVWHLITRIKTKPTGFIFSEEYRSMPAWLKLLFRHVFREDARHFAQFLEKASHKQNDFLKKCLRRRRLQIHQLTPDILEEELNRL